MVFTGVSSNSPCKAAGISRRAGRHAQRDIAKSAWMRMNLEAFTGLPASRPVIARCPLVQSTDERPLIVSSDETIRALKNDKGGLVSRNVGFQQSQWYSPRCKFVGHQAVDHSRWTQVERFAGRPILGRLA